MADQWRLTTDTNDNINADVTTNWERNDASSWSGIGTGLTESSGVFTLPQTGIYKIDYQGVFQVVSGDSKTQHNSKKASGKQKLLDLGLTEEEVKALIGV
jgi:hypothetical protein